jgi:hypothetical protein
MVAAERSLAFQAVIQWVDASIQTMKTCRPWGIPGACAVVCLHDGHASPCLLLVKAKGTGQDLMSR